MNRMNEEQELPQSWVWTTVNQLGKSVTGNTPSTSNPEFYGGDIPFFKPGDLGSGYSIAEAETYITEAGAQSARILPPYSTLVTCIGATIGKTGFSTVAGATNQQINALIPETAVVVPQFAYFGFISPILFHQILDNASSTTLPILNKSKFEALNFPLPPLPEQRRIVAKLEELFSKLDAGVAAVRRTQALLKRYRQSVLHAAVTGELTRAWRETHSPAPAETGAALLQRIRAERRAQWEAAQVAKRGGQLPLGEGWKSKYAEPEAVDTAGLPELPEGWAWVSPEQIASQDKYALAIGPFGSNLKVPDYRDEGVPLVFVREIKSGKFGGSKTKFVTSAKAEELRAHQVTSGDILITKMGEPPGDACLYPEGRPDAVITADCIKWTLSSNLMKNKEFFVYAINSHLVRVQVAFITQGVAQQKVSLGRFKTIAVPLPPLAEQTEIVAEVERRLTVLDALGQTLTDELKRAERLRQSILHQAFTGRLVPQDATDEPAAALLARLRETPASPAKAKAGRGRKAAGQIGLSF